MAADRTGRARRRRWLRVVFAGVALALLAYVGSYFCVRTFRMGRSGSMMTHGLAGFEYPGDQHVYALSKHDAETLFLFERLASGLAKLPIPIPLSDFDSPRPKGGREAGGFWQVYVPLERAELACRGLTPVFLSEEEKAALIAKVRDIKLPY